MNQNFWESQETRPGCHTVWSKAARNNVPLRHRCPNTWQGCYRRNPGMASRWCSTSVKPGLTRTPFPLQFLQKTTCPYVHTYSKNDVFATFCTYSKSCLVWGVLLEDSQMSISWQQRMLRNVLVCLFLSMEKRVHDIEELQRKDLGHTQTTDIYYKILMKKKLMVPMNKLFWRYKPDKSTYRKCPLWYLLKCLPLRTIPIQNTN